MEEDVEKIERFILLSKKTFGEATELAFALRRIKDRYRELEEENILWKGKYHLLSRKINVIPKSKIQEKIEEYKKRKENCNDIESEIRLDVKIRTYEELMEDK